MPAEAVHFSALDDTLLAVPNEVRAALTGAALLPMTRLGAMFVDLPYFESIGLTLFAHVLGSAPRPQPWGDRFHVQCPIALGVRLGEEGARLRARRDQRDVGHALVALALGYMSHAAVDSVLHPLVNELAAARARARREHPLRQHREVEKFQSVLFHEERHGRDYLGCRELGGFLALDATPLWRRGPLADTVQEVLRGCLGQAPEQALFQRWARGYGRFVALLSGPLGRHVVSAADKERERPSLYTAVDFPSRYIDAVTRSVDWVLAVWEHLESARFDAAARAALLRRIPEQPLDSLYD